MARWLEFRQESGDLSFPLKVWREENPDFIVEAGSQEIGIEITEAVDPDEQAVWTATAKEDQKAGTDRFHDVDQQWLDGKRYAQMVSTAVGKKMRRCSTACKELLVYLNTTDDLCDELAIQERKIGEVLENQRHFQCVWVLSGRGLMTFPRVVSATPVSFERAKVKPRDVRF